MMMMMEDMQVQRAEPSRYWPHDGHIPVLSETTINKLREGNVLVTGLDCCGKMTEANNQRETLGSTQNAHY